MAKAPCRGSAYRSQNVLGKRRPFRWLLALSSTFLVGVEVNFV
jgi:hypothetical protein